MGLRILILCDDHGTGGAALATHRLAMGLATCGHTVLYAQTPTDSARTAERTAAGIRAVDLPYDTLKYFALAIDDRRTPTALFLEHRPDIILFSDALVESTLGAKEGAAFLNIPYLTIKHLVLTESLYTRNLGVGERVRRSIDAAAGVITVSAQNRAVLTARFPKEAGRIEVIHNSVPDIFLSERTAEGRRVFRRRFNIPDDAVTVLTAAAIVRRKGFLHQARLIREMKAAGELDRFVFVWAGEGEASFVDPVWRDLEEAGCTDHIRRIGFQPDIAACLDGSDVLLLPSEQEGLPLVILEAMGKGVPVVATAVGGTPEALEAGGGVLVADPNHAPDRTVAEIRRTLLAWADDPAALAHTGAAGRRRVLEGFTTGAMLERYEAAIRRAAFPSGDYASPGLPLVKPDWALPFAARVPVGSGALCPHNRYADTRYPRMPFLNRDEALIVHATARRFAGRRALEIGGWLGWASCHLAAAGVALDVLDPFLGAPDIQQSVLAALKSWATQPVRLHAGASPEGVDALATGKGASAVRWSLFLIDGGRDGNAVLHDAMAAARHAEADAIILIAGRDAAAAEACRWLDDHGWRLRRYHTAGGITAAARGGVTPVDHEPDPAVDWNRIPWTRL